jgi:hypothetical protein
MNGEAEVVHGREAFAGLAYALDLDNRSFIHYHQYSVFHKLNDRELALIFPDATKTLSHEGITKKY